MTTLTLPPLLQAQKYPPDKKLHLLAQITHYSHELTRDHDMALQVKKRLKRRLPRMIHSEASFDEIFASPKIQSQFDLLADMVRGIAS